MTDTDSGTLEQQTASKWEEKQRIFDHLFGRLTQQITVSPTWRVAEFGIGRWGFARFYARHVSSVVGVDIEDYSAHHPGVEFVVSDGYTVPLADDSIDLTVSHSVLEHVVDLRQSLGEIDRITRQNGYVYLTVSPLYYSGYGAHLRRNGRRLENWEHLDPASEHYMSDDPLPGASTAGHALNRLTSHWFLSEVGRLPWSIMAYELSFEAASAPPHIDRGQCSELDLVLKGFRFIGRKERQLP